MKKLNEFLAFVKTYGEIMMSCVENQKLFYLKFEEIHKKLKETEMRESVKKNEEQRYIGEIERKNDELS